MKWDDCRSQSMFWSFHRKRTVRWKTREYIFWLLCKSCHAVFSRTEKKLWKRTLFFRPPPKEKKTPFLLDIDYFSATLQLENSSNSEVSSSHFSHMPIIISPTCCAISLHAFATLPDRQGYFFTLFSRMKPPLPSVSAERKESATQLTQM